MTKIEAEWLNQYAVLWPFVDYDEYGEPRVSSQKVELKVRWEHTAREAISPEGTPMAIDAEVIVDRKIDVGSVMRQGKIDDLPSPVDSLYRVAQYEEVPDVKGRYFLRRVRLQRLKESLPDLV